tara:strand:+ start:1068 stop:1313 length:246 start_codon:yes stop_codon:yes gene_type:complete
MKMIKKLNGRRIKTLREKMGISRAKLSKMIDFKHKLYVTEQCISMYEQNKIKKPNLYFLISCSDVLDVDLDFFLEENQGGL